MAFDVAASNPGSTHDGIRGLDNLETGVRSNTKRIPGAHRVRVHGTSGKISGAYHIVHAWAVIGVTSATGGAVTAIITARGHW